MIAWKRTPQVQSLGLARGQSSVGMEGQFRVCKRTRLKGADIVRYSRDEHGDDGAGERGDNNPSGIGFRIGIPEPEVPKQSHDREPFEQMRTGNIVNDLI